MVCSLGKQPGFVPQCALPGPFWANHRTCSNPPTVAPHATSMPRRKHARCMIAHSPTCRQPCRSCNPPSNILSQLIVLLAPATGLCIPCIPMQPLGPRTRPCWLAHTTVSWTRDSISSSDSDTPTVDEYDAARLTPIRERRGIKDRETTGTVKVEAS